MQVQSTTGHGRDLLEKPCAAEIRHAVFYFDLKDNQSECVHSDRSAYKAEALAGSQRHILRYSMLTSGTSVQWRKNVESGLSRQDTSDVGRGDRPRLLYSVVVLAFSWCNV